MTKAKVQPSASQAKEADKAPKTDKTTKAEKTTDTMASYLDQLLLKGGTWEEMAHKAEAEAARRNHVNLYVTLLKAHLNYRTKKNAGWLGELRTTTDGVFPKVPRGKAGKR
jgi:hypothetical protein